MEAWGTQLRHLIKGGFVIEIRGEKKGVNDLFFMQCRAYSGYKKGKSRCTSLKTGCQRGREGGRDGQARW